MVRIRNPITRSQRHGEVRGPSGPPEKDEPIELGRKGHLVELCEEIYCPVTAIHGDYDPHPSKGVEIPLASLIEDFELIILEKCGHCPWIERNAKDRFFDILKREIKKEV